MRDDWEELRGQRLFITGGTGFFGMWLLETFLWANQKLDLGAEVLVLSRDPAAFLRKMPHLAGHPDLGFHAGSMDRFAFPAGEFSHIIHAATESHDVPLQRIGWLHSTATSKALAESSSLPGSVGRGGCC